MDENNMNEHIMQIIGSQLFLLIIQTIKFNDENMLIIVIRPIVVLASFARQPFLLWTICWLICRTLIWSMVLRIFGLRQSKNERMNEKAY